MGKRLYAGNLAYKTRDDGLRAFFAQAGNVTSAEVVMEGRRSNRSKGFGFVEMSTDEEAQNAMNTLNGKMLDERPIRIDLANPKPERTDRPPRDDRRDDRPRYSDRPRYGDR
jgi:RNA recognition motif-containing protein